MIVEYDGDKIEGLKVSEVSVVQIDIGYEKNASMVVIRTYLGSETKPRERVLAGEDAEKFYELFSKAKEIG